MWNVPHELIFREFRAYMIGRCIPARAATHARVRVSQASALSRPQRQQDREENVRDMLVPQPVAFWLFEYRTDT